MLQHFLEYRHEVLTRRTQFELEKARARAHILEGLKIALDNLDAVIQTIRESASAEVALQTLQVRFTLSEIQARAILDMQLRRLAALERQQIIDEYNEILKTIAYLEDLLANPRKILLLVRDELLELKKKFGDARRTEVANDHRRRRLGGRAGPERRGPGHDLRPRLRQAAALGHLPGAAARRQGHSRPGAARRRRAAPHDHRPRPGQPALLHQPRQGLPAQGVPDPGVRADGQGHPADQRDRPRSEGVGHGDPGRARLREQRLPGDGHAPGRDQEDVAARLRVGPAQRPQGDGPRAERRAVLGQALRGGAGRDPGQPSRARRCASRWTSLRTSQRASRRRARHQAAAGRPAGRHGHRRSGRAVCWW